MTTTLVYKVIKSVVAQSAQGGNGMRMDGV